VLMVITGINVVITSYGWAGSLGCFCWWAGSLHSLPALSIVASRSRVATLLLLTLLAAMKELAESYASN